MSYLPTVLKSDWSVFDKMLPVDDNVNLEFPIKFDTVKSGWFIVYTEWPQVIISKKNYISFSED